MASTTTHQLVASGFGRGSGGSLDHGWARCECGETRKSSLGEHFAQNDLWSHISYMEKKTQKRGRR